MHLYQTLFRLRFLKSYSAKFLFVAFVGTHIPLLGVLTLVLTHPKLLAHPGQVLLVVLALTLVATGVTLYFLNQLVAPIRVAKSALETYLYQRTIPNLPVQYTDEAGLLLRDVQHTIVALEEMLREKKDLIGMLSHDLRSPASSTLSLMRLLEEDIDSPEMKDCCRKAERLLEGQLELMGSMLLMMHDEDPQAQAIAKEEVALQHLLHRGLEQLQGALSSKQVAVEVQVPPDLIIRVEPNAFSQVLVNLLGNAVKFSQPGGRITVSSEVMLHHTRIVIRDHGIGFDPARGQKLFDRFTEYRRRGTQGEPTNGIGLYLCKKTMERHGGQIEAYSEGTGRGATFSLILPQTAPAELYLV